MNRIAVVWRSSRSRSWPRVQPDHAAARSRGRPPGGSARRRSRARANAPTISPLAHDQDAVAHADQLLQLGRDEQDPAAVGGELVDDRVDVVLGGHVDAARRLVHDEHGRVRHQPSADDDLLLVASRQAQRRLLRDGAGLDAQPCRPSAAAASSRRAWSMKPSGVTREARQRGQRDVVRDGDAHEQPFLAPVLGDERDAVPDAAARRRADADACRRRTISPESNASRPNRMRASSVRPEPMRPNRPRTSPRWTVRSMSSTMPAADTLLTSSNGSAVGVAVRGGYSCSSERPTIERDHAVDVELVARARPPPARRRAGWRCRRPVGGRRRGCARCRSSSCPTARSWPMSAKSRSVSRGGE